MGFWNRLFGKEESAPTTLNLSGIEVKQGEEAERTQLQTEAGYAPATGTIVTPPAASVHADEIVPFGHVNGLTPGSSTQKDVEKVLGQPESLEKRKADVILKYPRRGMTIFVNPDSKIDSIIVEAPFKGKSVNGLHIGMPETDARRILNKDYFVATDLNSSTIFGANNSTASFQVWFAAGRLTTMRLDRPSGKPMAKERHSFRTSDFECARCKRVTHHSPHDDRYAGKLWVCDSCGYKTMRVG